MRTEEETAGRRAGVLLGLGLGGFVDGILLHQIAHWHNMGSSVVPPTTLEALRLNMRWDGLFHAAVWVCTLAGVYLLHAAARRRTPLPGAGAFTGLMILGWGLFNLVEGTIDHLLLGIHHVNETVARGQWKWWDLGFLLGGAAMLAGGWALARAGEAAQDAAMEDVSRAGRSPA